MLGKIITAYCRLLSWLMVGCLAVMVMLVFTNVVLRYAFNSGITVSEELARWLFVWMTFLGAVVALHERAHLGTDTLVARLSLRGKKFCLGLGHLFMLWICTMVLRGAWDQVQVNLTSTSAAMEAPLAVFYASGAVFAVLGGLVLLHDLFRLLTGRMSDSELIGVRESEEVATRPVESAR
jgi:TRAP-type C4-dicarboxylate transport system permease small subunit